MNEETTIIEKATVEEKPTAETRDSVVVGISLRGWIALIVVLTICGMSLFGITVTEPLYTIAGMIVAFYFGQQTTKKPTTP